jgi:hypothetical protein
LISDEDVCAPATTTKHPVVAGSASTTHVKEFSLNPFSTLLATVGFARGKQYNKI